MGSNKNLAIFLLILSFLIPPPAFSQDATPQAQSELINNQDYNFWIKKPSNWNRTQGPLGGDQAEQFIDSLRNAFVEVYASKMPPGLTLQYIADNWEARAQGKNIAYLQKRISSEQVDIKGASAILRIYEGATESIPLKSYLLFVYEKEMAYVVVGMFPQQMATNYEELVKEMVLSFSLLAP